MISIPSEKGVVDNFATQNERHHVVLTKMQLKKKLGLGARGAKHTHEGIANPNRVSPVLPAKPVTTLRAHVSLLCVTDRKGLYGRRHACRCPKREAQLHKKIFFENSLVCVTDGPQNVDSRTAQSCHAVYSP